MNAREIKSIESDIKFYGMLLSSKGLSHNQLINLSRAYSKIAELDKTRQKNSFEKALSYLNKAISLDGDDYDPKVIAARAELLIKINEYKLSDEIKEANGIYDQLERDKTLLQNGANKVKELDSISVGSTLSKINEVLSSKSSTENKTRDIFRKLGIHENAKPTSLINQMPIQQSQQAVLQDELRSENRALKKEIENLKAQMLVLQEENKRLTESNKNHIAKDDKSPSIRYGNNF